MATNEGLDGLRNGITQNLIFLVQWAGGPFLATIICGVITIILYLILHYQIIPKKVEEKKKSGSEVNMDENDEKRYLFNSRK